MRRIHAKFAQLCEMKKFMKLLRELNDPFVHRNAVKVQAEDIVTVIQPKYNECLREAESNLPPTVPYLESLKKCTKPEILNSV